MTHPHQHLEFLFPGLLSPSRGRVHELDELLNAHDQPVVLACSIECVSANTIISPSFFPVLQHRLLRACGSLDACVLRRGVAHLLPEHNGHRFHALLLLHESQRAIMVLLVCPSSDSAVVSSGVEVLDGLLRLVCQVGESYTCDLQYRQLCSHCVLRGDYDDEEKVSASDGSNCYKNKPKRINLQAIMRIVPAADSVPLFCDEHRHTML
jgi:hypothetical protein